MIADAIFSLPSIAALSVENARRSLVFHLALSKTEISFYLVNCRQIQSMHHIDICQDFIKIHLEIFGQISPSSDVCDL